MTVQPRSFLLATALSSLVLMPLTASAATDSATASSTFLVGASLTRDQSNLDDAIGTPPPGFSVSSPDAEWGHNLYVGLNVNEYLTLRLGQRRFGDAELGISTLGGSGKIEMEADGFYFAVDLLYPFNDVFALGATLGNQGIDATFKSGGVSASDDARDFFYGVRARFQLGEHGAAVAAYERYRFGVDASGTDDIEFDTLALGLEYSF